MSHPNIPQTIRGYDQPPYIPNQPGMHAPQQPYPHDPGLKRKSKKIHWFLYPSVAILCFVVGYSVGTSNETAVDSSSTPASAGEVTPGAKKPGPSAKKWVPLVTLKSNADKASDTFSTTGGRLRLTYNFTNNTDMVAAAVYVLKEGTDLNTAGGIPDVMVTQAGKDSTILRKGKGHYFVQVTSAGANYTVTVEEEK